MSPSAHTPVFSLNIYVSDPTRSPRAQLFGFSFTSSDCISPCPTPQPGPRSLLAPSGSHVINRTPQTLAKPLKQNCPRRQMADLISFPLTGLNPFQLIRGRKQPRTAGRFPGRRRGRGNKAGLPDPGPRGPN